MGLRATEILLQKLAWPKKRSWIPQQVIFEPRLSIRLSCAPPRPAMSADELSLEGHGSHLIDSTSIYFCVGDLGSDDPHLLSAQDGSWSRPGNGAHDDADGKRGHPG